MSILIAPERTSLRTALKRVGLPLLGDVVAVSLTDGVTSVGIGGAGKVGGVGVGMLTDTAELDTEAPGTHPRGSPLPPFLFGVSGDFLGATAPACGWICVVGVRGGVKGCLSGAEMLELDAGAPGTYPRDSLDSPSFSWVSIDSLGATAPDLAWGSRSRESCYSCRGAR